VAARFFRLDHMQVCPASSLQRQNCCWQNPEQNVINYWKLQLSCNTYKVNPSEVLRFAEWCITIVFWLSDAIRCNKMHPLLLLDKIINHVKFLETTSKYLVTRHEKITDSGQNYDDWFLFVLGFRVRVFYFYANGKSLPQRSTSCKESHDLWEL